MYLLTVAVINMCAGLVYGQSSQCQTPDGKSGECISLLKCRPLLEQLDKPNKTDQDLLLLSELLTKLHCGSVRVPFLPKVCCASEQQDSQAEAVYSNGTCIAHDGRPGKCISLLLCPYLEDMTVNDRGSTLWEKSKCKIPEGSICCPNRPNQIVQKRPGESLSKPRTDCQAKTTAFPPDPKSGCCGHWEGADDYIIPLGSGTLLKEQHPWHALIEYDNRDNELVLLCAGSLISGKYVLTAAHCLDGKILNLGEPKQVRLGEYDITQEGADCMTVPAHLQRSSRTGDDGMYCNEGVTRIRIETTIPHPGYNHRLISQWNDIGLIRLEETAPYTDFIRPICLPSKDLSQPANTPSYSVYAIGWDLVDLGRERYTKLKRVFGAPLVSHEKCLLNHNNHSHYAFTPVPLRQGHLCAGGYEAIDDCTEDDGGPLVTDHQDRFELIGVKSFGPVSCLEKDFPGVYTNVYDYLDWIKSVIIQ